MSPIRSRFSYSLRWRPQGQIKLDGNELIVRGSHRRLSHAIGFLQKRKLGEVPSFVNGWRARRDSNPRPLASEANTLSI